MFVSDFLDAANTGNHTMTDGVGRPPTIRGAWNIYQSCVMTMILCTWTAMHPSPPGLDEHPGWQWARKIWWAYLALILPELVGVESW
jgi:hypothetical protein